MIKKRAAARQTVRGKTVLGNPRWMRLSVKARFMT
jgi:hypothetical protein